MELDVDCTQLMTVSELNLDGISAGGAEKATNKSDPPDGYTYTTQKSASIPEEISPAAISYKETIPKDDIISSPPRSPLSTSNSSAEEPHLSPNQSQLVFGCTEDELVQNRKLITVCIHGNEVCGLIAVNELIDENFFEDHFSEKVFSRDRVTILLGNPKAVEENKRFIDVNLNRIFYAEKLRKKKPEPKLTRKLSVQLVSNVFEKAPPTKQCYELSRISVLAEAVEDCDEYIDIHSTSAKSHAFALPALDSKSEEFARSFCAEFVIEKLVKSVPGTSIGWASTLNKKAVCFECGQHEDRESVEMAKGIIKRFLTGHVTEQAKAVLLCEENERVRKGFKYNHGHAPRAFKKVEFNDVIAEDDEVGEIRCQNPEGSYIIMPTASPIIGEEGEFGVEKGS